ncbi:hypothetical protein GF337_15620, partial [candidate division KSB1 bacterium]|nr:hypothetical protein [candidate division KSB1 bacterium]
MTAISLNILLLKINNQEFIMGKIQLIYISLFFSVSLLNAGISDFDVMDFGAMADGKTDNTSAFKAALNKAAEKGGIVHVPAGQFRFDGVLTIPRGVTLQGIARGPYTVFY